jgi:hypothetical protein
MFTEMMMSAGGGGNVKCVHFTRALTVGANKTLTLDNTETPYNFSKIKSIYMKNAGYISLGYLDSNNSDTFADISNVSNSLQVKGIVDNVVTYTFLVSGDVDIVVTGEE